MTTTSPAVPACLSTPYSSKPDHKGGTLIFEGVDSLQEHRQLLCDPGGYRPERCSSCGSLRLHAHDFRVRVLDDGEQILVETIRRFRCANKACKAVWRILPAVIARHLHRTWQTVQQAASGSTKVSEATVRRWRTRLGRVATGLTQLLATTAEQVRAVTDSLSIACTRVELVAALVAGGLLDRSRQLQQLAAWIHRIEPGVRLV